MYTLSMHIYKMSFRYIIKTIDYYITIYIERENNFGNHQMTISYMRFVYIYIMCAETSVKLILRYEHFSITGWNPISISTLTC